MTRLRNPSLWAHVLLVAVVLIWGATFVVVKDAIADVSPLLFNALRMSMAAAVLLLANVRHLKRVSRQAFALSTLAGFFLALGYELQTAGLALTTPAKCAFITGLVVVFVPILDSLPGGQRSGKPLNWNILAGASLAFTGLALLTTPAHTSWNTLFLSLNKGDFLSLLCAIAFATHLLTLSRATHRVSLQQLSTLQILAAAVFMLVTLPVAHTYYLHLTTRLLVALIITGVFATAAAFTIQSWAQRYMPPTHTAILLTLEPVFAWLTSFIFLHERLSHRSLAGAALILAAITVLELLTPSNPIPA